LFRSGLPAGSNALSVESRPGKTGNFADGANEIDRVVALASVLSGDWEAVQEDIAAVFSACGTTPLKVIFETCLLDSGAIDRWCATCSETGVAFVKTSTGFSTGGATVEVAARMRRHLDEAIEVKASGGIRDRETALARVEAGATRLGTSAGVAIVSGGKVSPAAY